MTKFLSFLAGRLHLLLVCFVVSSSFCWCSLLSIFLVPLPHLFVIISSFCFRSCQSTPLSLLPSHLFCFLWMFLLNVLSHVTRYVLNLILNLKKNRSAANLGLLRLIASRTRERTSNKGTRWHASATQCAGSERTSHGAFRALRGERLGHGKEMVPWRFWCNIL